MWPYRISARPARPARVLTKSLESRPRPFLNTPQDTTCLLESTCRDLVVRLTLENTSTVPTCIGTDIDCTCTRYPGDWGVIDPLLGGGPHRPIQSPSSHFRGVLTLPPRAQNRSDLATIHTHLTSHTRPQLHLSALTSPHAESACARVPTRVCPLTPPHGTCYPS